MGKRFVILVALAMFSIATTGSVQAETPQSYLNWFTKMTPNLRTAIVYLRTGNPDLAAIALEDLIAAKPAAKLAKPFDVVAGDVISRAQKALGLIDDGKERDARKALLLLRQKAYLAHQSNNITTFSDCIWELKSIGPALWFYRRKQNRPDLSNPKELKAVRKVTAQYLVQLEKCDAIVPQNIKADGDYARLVTGARTSLKRIPRESLANKDGDQLFRFIIELKSFDRLLFFRFG